MVNVTEIGEMGAYVTLIEYDDIEVSRSGLMFSRVPLVTLFPRLPHLTILNFNE